MNQWLLSCLGALSVLACSSDEPGPKEDTKLRTQAGFCNEWAKATCNARVVEECDSSPEDCVENQTAYCLDLIPIGYNGMHAQQCIDAVGRAYNDAALTADELRLVQRLEGACSQLVDGGLEEGDVCYSPLDCNTIEGYTCVIKAGAASGTCQVPETVGGGASCDDLEVVCEEGFYCDGEDCVSSDYPDDEEDVPCAYNAECGASGVCDVASSVCVARLENGESCTTDEECESGYCLAASAICVSRVALTIESSVCDDL